MVLTAITTLGASSPTGITIDPANVSNIWIVDAAGTRLRELTREGAYDLLHCEWTPYARLREGLALPWVVAAHNIESQVWRRLAQAESSLPRRLYAREQARKMARLDLGGLLLAASWRALRIN